MRTSVAMRRTVAPLALALAMLASPSSARAVGLTLKSESTPWPGVVVKKYRTSSPATNAWATFVDLCAPSIHVDATRYSSSFRSTGAWASDRGVQVATNGDFFKASPTRVYGQAVGDGVNGEPLTVCP